MSKKVLVERVCNRQNFVKKFYLLRLNYKKRFINRTILLERFHIHIVFQKIPHLTYRTSVHNRCQISGRSRSYFRNFTISRHFIREFTNQGVLPGVKKSCVAMLETL